MALSLTGTFKCILLTPSAKLLECRTTSIILPAHDGHRGVLRNHAPMLCKLDRGILQVRNIKGRGDAFFLIEGGFARVSLNNITILTHEAITFDEMDKEEAEQMISDAKSVVVGKAYIKTQIGEVDAQKSALIVKLAELSKVG